MSGTRAYEVDDAVKASWAAEYSPDRRPHELSRSVGYGASSASPISRDIVSEVFDDSFISADSWLLHPAVDAATEEADVLVRPALAINSCVVIGGGHGFTDILAGLNERMGHVASGATWGKTLGKHSELGAQKADSLALNLVRNIGRLKDGWAGPDSRAPSSTVTDDILRILFSTNILVRGAEPEIEVEADYGFVSLRWFDADHQNSLTITFYGGGRIIATYSSLVAPRLGAREFSTQDIGELSSFLSETSIENIF